MPLQATAGAATYDAFGGGVTAANYIEDVFSTWLYTGNGSSQTITNGIDLSTKGGLVWMKGRSGATDHALYDTARGTTKDLVSNSAAAETTQSTGLTAFSSTGFSIGALAKLNTNADTYASWTFRKQPKFFDVVTYTGDGVAGRQISHSLGSVPGCILVKVLDAGNGWPVYHRSLGNTDHLRLEDTRATASDSTYWNNTTPTSTVFTVGDNIRVNASGNTYVAYLFAHDAGGFGASGTDNVISCGSYVGNGSTTGPIITLGYEPQWVMIKAASSTSQWHMYDTMRGWTDGSIDSILYANLSNAEDNTNSNLIRPLATGFQPTANYTANTNGDTYIYIAIRRGPMRTPTTGTSVFTPTLTSATTGTAITVGFPIDSQWSNLLAGDGNNTTPIDRLRGMSSVSGSSTANRTLFTSNIATESSSFAVAYLTGVNNTGWVQGSYSAGLSAVRYDFRRAPGFFDVVCYTGNGGTKTNNHNLTAVPELIIIKNRSGSVDDWYVYSQSIAITESLFLNNTNAKTSFSNWGSTSPTASQFTVSASVSGNNINYVAYLFATVAGVSKVGSYTGTGTTLQINCGFTGGARFVMIKRTDSTGDWYVWDSARGIVAGNDPYLLLNTATAEVTNTDFVDTFSSGFEISSTAPAAINANGGTFIFLAIA